MKVKACHVTTLLKVLQNLLITLKIKPCLRKASHDLAPSSSPTILMTTKSSVFLELESATWWVVKTQVAGSQPLECAIQ